MTGKCMIRIRCLLLLLMMSSVWLASCAEKAAPIDITSTPMPEAIADTLTPGFWPTLGFFGSIPKAVDELDHYGVAETENGTVYTFQINTMTYESFYTYIEALKKNGFVYYDVMDGDISEATYLPAETPESGTANWHGKKSEHCFVVANWYSVSYQQTVDLSKGYNCMLVFYGFNPYAAFEVTPATQ